MLALVPALALTSIVLFLLLGRVLGLLVVPALLSVSFVLAGLLTLLALLGRSATRSAVAQVLLALLAELLVGLVLLSLFVLAWLSTLLAVLALSILLAWLSTLLILPILLPLPALSTLLTLPTLLSLLALSTLLAPLVVLALLPLLGLWPATCSAVTQILLTLLAELLFGLVLRSLVTLIGTLVLLALLALLTSTGLLVVLPPRLLIELLPLRTPGFAPVVEVLLSLLASCLTLLLTLASTLPLLSVLPLIPSPTGLASILFPTTAVGPRPTALVHHILLMSPSRALFGLSRVFVSRSGVLMPAVQSV